MGQPIRIILADDHPLYRQGLRVTLLRFGNYEIVAECDNASGTIELAKEHHPDIVLLDISMPGGGIAAAREIAMSCPTVRMIMLTASESNSDVKEALEIGACGYVLKGIGGDELGNIIEIIHGGGAYVSPGIAARVLMDARQNEITKQFDCFSELSEREEPILRKLALGLTNNEIAQSLDLNERSVDRHLTNIMRKLGVRNRLEAALKANSFYDRQQEK